MTHRYGHFSDCGTEFVVTTPQTPRAFDNFLWNDSIYANVQQTGVGCLDYQVNDTEGVQLYTGIGRTCDFDVFGRDHLMSRLLYLRDNANGAFWNINWEPVKRPYQSYECTQGLGFTKIKNVTDDVTGEFLIFIPEGKDPVELWSIKITNNDSRSRSLSLFTYNQLQFKYKWGFDSYGDMIYRNSLFDHQQNTLIATKHPFKKPHNFLTGFMAADTPVVAFDGSRDAFVGTYSTLADPHAVVTGRCTNTPGSNDATIGALQFDLELAPGETRKIEIIVGATDDAKHIEAIKGKYFGQFDSFLNEVRTAKSKLVSHNEIQTPDKHLDRLINAWTKQATAFGATWCRWGYNGFRDIVQQGFGVVSFNPTRTRAILLKAFQHQYASGMAIRGWNPIDEKPYSDSALWLVFTLIPYLKETGELSILDEDVPFYDTGSATVLNHVERALDFLEQNKGSHGLCLIKFGDWNDSLTGVGKEGRGESIWLSQAYAEAMRLMAELMGQLGNKDKQAAYLERRRLIANAINEQGWDGEYYTRCYDDSGRAIGSHTNEFARIFMEPQCWALIAGLADDARAEQLLASCDKLLGTEMGYLLLQPAFTRIDDNIGRISSMEPGICENGTVYSHLNIWMILGLLRYGMGDRAYELFKQIAPGYVSGEDDLKQRCSPFMISNCYYGPEHRNNAFQQEYTWITGSVAWFNNVIVNEMIGAKAEHHGLVINPCLPKDWNQCSIRRTYRGGVYHINIHNPGHLNRGKVRLVLDGKPIEGNTLPPPEPGSSHLVDAYLE